ncbi:MAG: ABC transporter ATP-binding protein [Bacteroidales bacterium]|nr:ABC transporter ATP-binding protein [Bacteroidales bacterium]
MKSLAYSIRAAWEMSRHSRWRITISILAGLVRVVASLSFVWVCRLLVDIVTNHSNVPLNRAITLLAVTLVVLISSRVFSSWWESMTEVKTKNYLRRKYFEHVLNSTWNGTEAYHSADTVNRLEEDIRVVTDIMCLQFPNLVVTCCQLVAASVFTLTLAPQLLWIMVILMVIAIVGSRMYFTQLRKLTNAIRSKDSEAQQVFQDNLRSRILVLMLFGPSRVLGKLDNLQTDIENLTRKRLNFNAISRTFMGIGFMGGYAAAFLWGVLGISSGAVTYGMMTAMLQLVGQVQRPISEIGSTIPAFIRAITSVERLAELTDLTVEEQGEPIQVKGAPGIKMNKVSFSYPTSSEILTDFSFDFKPGKITTIVGPTGSGKSTMMKIIMGLLHPTKGEVVMYTEDGKETPISASTRCNFMYVPQGKTLLSGTVRENLLLADPTATDERLKEVLSIAEASFVMQLPNGLDTMCGEDGNGLSDGQCQRIAIARALLRPGGVLLLDEATSALDSKTENRLLENLCNTYKGNKTILFISHRETVAKFADALLEFESR